MRHFSDEEKSFIRKIEQSDGHDVCLMSLLLPHVNKEKVGLSLSLGSNSNNVSLHCGSEEKNIDDKCRRLQRLIARMGNLIRYLEEEGYLITITPTNVKTASHTYGDFYGEQQLVPAVPWVMPDATTTKFVTDYFEKELIPTPLMSSLVNNGFQSVDELRFQKQQKATWAAIAVALFVGFLSLGFAGYQTWISRNAGEIQGWQYLGQMSADISKVFVDHPRLRPYFYDGKPLEESDPDFQLVETLAEMFLDFIDSFEDPPIKMLNGMEKDGKNWVLWKKYFTDTFSSSPVLCRLATEEQDWYAVCFTNYMANVATSSVKVAVQQHPQTNMPPALKK